MNPLAPLCAALLILAGTAQAAAPFQFALAPLQTPALAEPVLFSFESITPPAAPVLESAAPVFAFAVTMPEPVPAPAPQPPATPAAPPAPAQVTPIQTAPTPFCVNGRCSVSQPRFRLRNRR